MPVLAITANSTLQYGGSVDTTLVSQSVTSVFISADAPDYPYFGDGNVEMALGGGDSGASVANSIITSDAIAANVPAGATINSAILRINGTGGFGNNAGLVAAAVLRDWVQAEATWNSFSTGNAWETAGGSGALDRSAVTTSTDIGAGYYDITITDAVQQLIDGTGYGAILDPPPTFAFRNASNENGTDGVRPEFIIDYTVGGPTPPAVDAGTGGSVESGSPFQLNATITPGSDASPTILWSVQSGVGGSFSATNIEDPTFTPGGVGDSTLLLTVTPNDGPAVTDTVVVTGTAVSVTSITVTGITGGANLTDLQYMIVSSPDMSIATILDQGSGETTDANGDLFIPMTPGPTNGTQVWYFIKDVAGNNAAQGPATVTVT